MLIYRFRMLSDQNDNFVRDYDVPSIFTLLDFHDFIIDSLEYEPCITSFFTADAQWEKLAEFTTVDMGFEPSQGDEVAAAPQAMDSVRLCDVMHYMHDRLIYNFDLFASRAYYLELVDAKEVADPNKYPCEVFAHATAPDQFDPDASVDDGSIFEEMMGDFGDFDGDDAYDDGY
ncbi:MAG: hypothetical protein SNF93_03820 [Rikenellaceae bacterium]